MLSSNYEHSLVAMDMIHSTEELHHALSHLIPSYDYLQGHECLALYRNVRKKYVDYPVKEGAKQICSFRSVEKGILAAYQAGICFENERPASSLYVGINPRHVPEALKETHEIYSNWLEYRAGATKQKVRGGHKDDFGASLSHKFEGRILACKSREQFSMIDVDCTDPNTWLSRIRSAIGEGSIAMVIQTKNGFHVVYEKRKMTNVNHKSLKEVLESDSTTHKEASVTSMNGPAISCALPGSYQTGHKTTIYSCSCNKGKASL